MPYDTPPEVAYYYVQNGLLFVKRDRLAEYPALAPHVVEPDDPALDRVHPRKWMEANDPTRQTLRTVLQALPHSVRRAVARRLGRGD